MLATEQLDAWHLARGAQCVVAALSNHPGVQTHRNQLDAGEQLISRAVIALDVIRPVDAGRGRVVQRPDRQLYELDYELGGILHELHHPNDICGKAGGQRTGDTSAHQGLVQALDCVRWLVSIRTTHTGWLPEELRTAASMLALAIVEMACAQPGKHKDILVLFDVEEEDWAILVTLLEDRRELDDALVAARLLGNKRPAQS